MYRQIVAGTDLSKTARIATDRAAWLADALRAELILVHAGSDPGPRFKELAESYGAEARVVSGNPAEALIGEAERTDAGLLVVGSVGMRGARRFLLGNVPNKVSHHATTDLLIVKTDPPGHRGGYRSMLVGTDGSNTAMKPVDAASALAKALGIRATIACAYEPPTKAELEALRSDPNDPIALWDQDPATSSTPDEFRWRVAAGARAEDVLDRAAERAGRTGAPAETRAVQGPAAEALLEVGEREDFDLIVVGNIGMTGAQRMMLGNVPHRISHHSPTDVLIVRTG
jgi:nucleotide-binding universal stress UspA family protein